MNAAERVGCNYLGVYAVDVLWGTRGQANFDPEYEAALAHGSKVMGQTTVAAGAEPPEPVHPQTSQETVTQNKGAAPAEARAPQGFQLDGQRWTYRDGEFAMNGILLKPEGKRHSSYADNRSASIYKDSITEKP